MRHRPGPSGLKANLDPQATGRFKYRGSSHGHNEYPFLITTEGLWILPVTSIAMTHEVSDERISTGIPRLDTMLEDKGGYRGSSILVSGTAGTGKYSLAASFIHAARQRGERALYLSFEESPGQIMRNMRSIGIDLAQWRERNLLRIEAKRPSFYGLEMHLVKILHAVNTFRPHVVALDPVSALSFGGVGTHEIATMLMRLMDALKERNITAILINLIQGGTPLEATDTAISSIADSWLMLKDMEVDGERNRMMYILKSRGMIHSNQIREFLITGNGIDLIDVYTGPAGVLTGSARLAQEAKEAAEKKAQENKLSMMKRQLENKRRIMEAKIEALRSEYSTDEAEALRLIEEATLATARLEQDKTEMAERRKADRRKRVNNKEE